MKSNYLVCYDISEPQRLSKVFRFMKGRGVHLQYSVFFCTITWPELKRIKEDLSELINLEEDDIRIYPVPLSGKVFVLGMGSRIPDGVDLYIDGSSLDKQRHGKEGLINV